MSGSIFMTVVADVEMDMDTVLENLSAEERRELSEAAYDEHSGETRKDFAQALSRAISSADSNSLTELLHRFCMDHCGHPINARITVSEDPGAFHQSLAMSGHEQVAK